MARRQDSVAGIGPLLTDHEWDMAMDFVSVRRLLLVPHRIGWWMSICSLREFARSRSSALGESQSPAGETFQLGIVDLFSLVGRIGVVMKLVRVVQYRAQFNRIGL